MTVRFHMAAFLVLSASFLSAQSPRSADATAPVSPTAAKASAAASSGAVPGALPARVVRAAMSYLGVPYVHAGDSRAGMDCSGLVYRVFFDTVGESLPRGVEGLYRATTPTQYPLHLGDLVFFDTTEREQPRTPTHVGVYVGRGRIVHAASEGSKTGVVVSAIEDPYYRDRFIGARRVMPWRPPVLEVAFTEEQSAVTQVEPFASHQDVTIRVFNAMRGGGPVELRLMKDGKQVLSRWITAGTQKPAEVSFESSIGAWSVRIARIYKGRLLTDVAFAVVE